MKIDIAKKINIKQLLETFLLITMPVICVCGSSFIPYKLRPIFIVAVGFVSLIYMIMANVNLKVNALTLSYFLILVYMAISLIYTIDIEITRYFLFVYLCAFPLLFLDLSENLCNKMIKVFYIITLVIACSIILSVFIDDCMNRFFWPIINPTRSSLTAWAIRNELSQGSYSGLARERGAAALIMNVGIACSLSNFFTKGKLTLKEGIGLAVLIIALLLTGKRMMLIIPIVIFLVLFSFVSMKGKAGKFVLIFVVTASVVFIILNFSPTLANTFIRFTDTENLESAGNREILWEYVYNMIRTYYWFGAGFGTYNTYAYNHGMRSGDHKWNYFGHNIYYEAIGEIGIVGSIFLFSFLIIAFVFVAGLLTNKGLADSQRKIVIFSFYIQLMLLIYGVTGNPLFSEEQIFLWIFAISMVLPIYYKIYGSGSARLSVMRKR